MNKVRNKLICLILSVILFTAFSAASNPIVNLTSVDDVCVADTYMELKTGALLFSDGLLSVCLSDKWGYVNMSGEIVHNFIFDKAAPFEDGFAYVEKEGKKLIINKKGTVTADVSQYDRVENSGDGIFIVESDGLFGTVSASGVVKITPAWDSISRASEDMHVVSKNNQYGFVTTSGTVVLEPAYIYANPFSEEVAYVETTSGAHQLIDRSGTVLLEQAYSSVTDGIAIVQQDGLWGFADQSGEIHVECVWDDVQAPSEGLVAVCKDDLWGFADYSGTVVIDPQWDFVWDFSNDMAITAEISSRTGTTDRYGCINKIGLEIVSPQYPKLMPFSDGYAAFLDAETNLWGYLDKNGTVAIDAQYDEAFSFSKGYALVRKGSKYSVIDTKGILLTMSNTENHSWLVPGESTKLNAPMVEETPVRTKIDVGRIISLILSLALIAFFIVSLFTQVILQQRKKRRKASAVQSVDYMQSDADAENYFGSVMDLNKQTYVPGEDYNNYDISAYYDDLDGTDSNEDLEDISDSSDSSDTIEK